MTPGRADDRAEETDRLAIRMIEVETSLSEIKDSMMTEAKMKGMMPRLPPPRLQQRMPQSLSGLLTSRSSSSPRKTKRMQQKSQSRHSTFE